MFEWIDPFTLFTLDAALITTLLVVAVHITFRAGLFSLAPLGFAAIGAYTTAVLTTKQGWAIGPGIAAATIGAAALAALFAIPVLRLRGIYLALGSVALAQAIIIGISNISITNGTLGIAGIPNLLQTDHYVVALVIVFVVLQLQRRSHFGRAVDAVRLDERTAEGLGINVFRVRFAAFVTSAALAGLAGALEAHRTTVISPEQFGFVLVIPLFTYALVGGNGHWLGPVLTGWALIALREWLGFVGTTWENLVYGALLIVVMMVAPSGLTDPALMHRVRRLLRRGKEPSTAESPAGGGRPPGTGDGQGPAGTDPAPAAPTVAVNP